MSEKVFDYANKAIIRITAQNDLLERIAENIEGEIEGVSNPDCTIHINQSKNPIEIKKDKRFDYLTIDKFGTEKQPSIRYTRYNTPVRIIHQKSPNEYGVDVQVKLDESSGLICIRNYLNNHPMLAQYPLLHASLLDIDGRGILILGDSRQGKTTLAVYLLQDRKAVFVSDENVFLEINEEKIHGLYVPRTSRVRFSTIAESGLSKVLEDIRLANATQYIDPDAIEKIIATCSFNVDAGIAFSRKAFCDLLGTKSKESSLVDKVLFTKYSRNMNAKSMKPKEALQRLSRAGLIRTSEIDPKEIRETIVDLNIKDFKEVEFVEIEFSGVETLRKGGFRI